MHHTLRINTTHNHTSCTLHLTPYTLHNTSYTIHIHHTQYLIVLSTLAERMKQDLDQDTSITSAACPSNTLYG
ncbi:hypothetical protein EON63_20785, partial [archaeon]